MSKHKSLAYTCVVFLTAIIACSPLGSGTPAQAAEEEFVKTEIVIKVKPQVIVLPEGEAARVPISAARVRSTDLRKLNGQYNAVSIEKLYQLQDQAALGLKLKGLRGGASTKKQADDGETVDLTKIFSQRMKKKFITEKKEVVELKTIFSIQFELKPDVNINDLLSEYRAVDAVLHAEVITRTSEDENK